MGQKGRDRSRRRGFDSEHSSGGDWEDERPTSSSSRFAPRESAAATGPAIDGVVKWFNAEKGFGFVELADGSGDVFLHAAMLESRGHATVEPGTKLSVQVAVGPKGRQVTAVLTVDTSSAVAPVARPAHRPSSGRERPDPATATSVEGTVKWYKAEKGFGFVRCDDGEKDVFLHASVLERAGLQELNEGQRVVVKVVTTQKGREAISVSLLK